MVQRVKGGVEYTEDTPTTLGAYLPPFPGPARPKHMGFNIGPNVMSGFRVGQGRHLTANADLGIRTNQDFDVLSSTPNVKLTNDVDSAEWVIERHHVDLPVEDMKARLKEDVTQMFATRAALANVVNEIQSGHNGEAAIANGPKATTHNAGQVFIYHPGPVKGKAQITAKYTNEDTIRRINKLNVSKFLTETKVAEGEDVSRVAGTESQALLTADVNGTTSFSTAGVLLNALVGTSNAIPQSAVPLGPPRLTAQQVGLVKLMIINDALATTMVRYQATVGQAQDKNIQRWFPKSRRNEYVKALAQADLDTAEITALWNEIAATLSADAQLVFNSADAGALRTDEAFTQFATDITPDPADPTDPRHATYAADWNTLVGMQLGKQQLLDPTRAAPSAAVLLEIRNTVLGPNGTLLEEHMEHVAHAYAEDLPTTGEEHYRHEPTKANQTPQDIVDYGMGGGGVVSNVIVTSRGFTPLGGDRGALYEMREREVPIDKSGVFNIGSEKALHQAIAGIFGAAE